jgi:sugar lactone lactonase YvrE
MRWKSLGSSSSVEVASAVIHPESGRKIDEVRLPVTNVTSCAFGGLELKTLYITTARIALDDDELKQQPQAGGLFRAAVGVSGVAAMTFAG